LWAVRNVVPMPWAMIRYIGQDMHSWILGQSFLFEGHWYRPGLWFFQVAYLLIARSPEASLAVAGAFLAGGIVAVIADKLAIRWNTQPVRSIK